jgi:DNA-binding MarR family transcriptional regulator
VKREAAPRISFELLGASHRVAEHLEASLVPLGLSLAKLGALSKLVAAGEPLPLSTLAALCACVRSNITQLVDRLEADGLVTRSDDPRDRRSVRAELTDEGRRRQAAGLRAIEKAEREMLAHLPRPKQDALLELLQALRDDARE